MCWPMQALSPFVTGPDVISHITGWAPRKSASAKGRQSVAPRFLILAAEQDVLCTPPVLLDATQRYRARFQHCVKTGTLDGISESDVDEEDGVSFTLVKGVAHHLQNHVEWEKGAEEVLRWAEDL